MFDLNVLTLFMISFIRYERSDALNALTQWYIIFDPKALTLLHIDFQYNDFYNDFRVGYAFDQGMSDGKKPWNSRQVCDFDLSLNVQVSVVRLQLLYQVPMKKKCGGNAHG